MYDYECNHDYVLPHLWAQTINDLGAVEVIFLFNYM